MIATTFRHAKDNIPKLHDVDWEGLKTLVGRHRVVRSGDKRDAPAISPTEYADGAPRSNRNALRVHFAVADCDKLTSAEMERVLSSVNGCAAIFYTTFSHPERHAKDGSWSFRLVLPFSRPVDASEWRALWPRLDARLGGHCDPKCKNLSRIYFLPSAPSDGPDNVLIESDGDPVDVDGLLEAPEPSRASRPGPQTVGADDLEELAGRLIRKTSQKLRSYAHAVRRALRGERFAVDGSRDSTMFELACVMAEEWPEADASQVAEHFRASLEAMAGESPDCPTVEDMVEKISRRQEQVLQEAADRERARADAMASRVRASFGGGRDAAYTEEEIERFAQAAGCSVPDFKRRWVIQSKSGYYFFHDGQYLPACTKEEAIPAAERALSPAHPHGISVWRRTESGDLRPKQPQDLVLEYGEQAERVVVDLAAQRSSYDGRCKVMVEAPTPLRDLEPERVDEVEQWLLALGWDQHELLLDWLATATQLDDPCAALYLHGPPDCGKTLFAEGVSRLWTVEGPTPMEDAVGDFNEAILKCPLVFADERMPRKLRESGGTGDLRQMIQARSRTLNRKFKPPATLRGALRVVMAANNMHMLDSDEMLTPEDSAALAERILYIRVTGRAVRALADLGFGTVAKFVEEDWIARHALWLRDSRVVERRHRFLVSGVNSELHRSMTVGRGTDSAVCCWCVSYLLNPAPVDSTRDLLVRVKDKRLLVTARGLAKNWTAYETNWRPPAPGRIARTLSSLSGPKKQLPDGAGKPTNYWPIKTDNLLTWNELFNSEPEERILEALENDTKAD